MIGSHWAATAVPPFQVQTIHAFHPDIVRILRQVHGEIEEAFRALEGGSADLSVSLVVFLIGFQTLSMSTFDNLSL